MTPILSHQPMDCFKCCVATVLDLNYDDVPSFFKDIEPGDIATTAQQMFTQQWFALKGFYLINFAVEATSIEEMLTSMFCGHPGVHYILGGQTRRGRNHAVVCKDDDIVHDPNGSMQGLTSPYDDDTFQVYMVGVLL